MVADRLRVGRADADIDEGDSAAGGSDQMVGRHLHLAPAARRNLGDRVRRVAGDEDPARGGERFIGAVLPPQLVDRPADELVDVADIVGEQQVALRVLDRRAGIMAQPGEAEIDAGPVEKGERPVRVAAVIPGAVRDLVADIGELGRREPAAEVGGVGAVEPEVVGAVEDIGVRDLARRRTDRNLDLVVADQIFELLGQIFAEMARPGDADRVAAGLVQSAEGPRREGGRLVEAVVDPELGIGEQAAQPRLGVRPLTAKQVARQRPTQGRHGFVEHLAKLVDDGGDGFEVAHLPLPFARLRALG
jgi:hypothetical protein